MTDSCKHVLKIKTSIQLGILSPDKWHCHVCNTTESVWACLSCSNFACGRYIAEHALQHFQSTGHSLCIEVNEKFVFCYLCDDFVLNDNAPGDIKLLRMALDAVTAQNFRELSKQKRGRRILRFHIRDVKRITRRLLKADDVQTAVMRHRVSRLSWALHRWWSHYLDKKRAPGISSRVRSSISRHRSLAFSPAFTGLRNLGNTCYMNSVLQVLRHTAPFANFVMSHPPSEILLASKRRRSGRLCFINIPDSQTPCRPSTALSLPSHTESPLQVACANSPPVYPTYSPVSSQAFSSICTSAHIQESSGINLFDPSASSDSVGGLNGGRCGHRGSNECQQVMSASPILIEPAKSGHNSIYEELYKILHTLWSSQRAVVSPSNLLYTIWTALPSFKGYRQQDAQEFLSIFLERLQSEIHGDSGVVSANSRDFVSRTFQGHCVSHIRCSDCNLVACTEEPFTELSLALPPDCYNGSAMECDLIDLLRQFVSPTPIDGKSYACRECSRRREPHRSCLSRANVSLASFHSPKDSLQRCSSPPTPYEVDRLVSVALSRLSSSAPECAPHFSSNPDAFVTSSAIGSHNSSKTASPDPSEDVLSSCCNNFGHKLLSPLRNPVVSVSLLNQSTCSACIMDDSSQSTGPCLTSATQTIRLSRLPRVLRLHIKRFRWIGRQREKVGCHVAFPLILDLSEFVLNEADRLECSRTHLYDNAIPQPSVRLQSDLSMSSTVVDDPAPSSSPSKQRRRYLYHLTGVIVHHGRGFQSGHYTAYCLNDQPECWLSCNDANVSLCDYAEVASSQAYLLFYSELMPTSPYPSWFSKSKMMKHPANLKRVHPTAFTGHLLTKSDGVSSSTVIPSDFPPNSESPDSQSTSPPPTVPLTLPVIDLTANIPCRIGRRSRCSNRRDPDQSFPLSET